MKEMDWLIPRLSLSAEAQLAQNLHDLQKHGSSNPKAVLDLACSLLQQTAIHQALLRQATHRIAELERQIGLNGLSKNPSLLRRLLAQIFPRKTG